MGEAFIVRKGGVAVERTTAPSINFVSKTSSEIVVTFTNNDAAEAEIYYGITSTLTDTVTLAAAATSSNITFSGLDEETTFTVSAYALVTDPTSKKIKSEIVTSTITTDKFVFDPATLSPQLWLDAADASTITASSGSVSQWNNKGSLSNFTQGTGASQPTTGVTTLNGLNVINFANDFLTATNQNEWKFMHDGTIHEIFTVFRYGTSTSDTSRATLLGNHAGSGANVGFSVDFNAGFNGRALHLVFMGGGSGVIAVQNDTGTTNFVPRFEFNIYHVFADPNNGTLADRSEHRLNNGNPFKSNTDSNSASGSNPSFALQIGRMGNNALTFTGSIAEMIVLSGSNVTSGNRTTVVNYLADKWGITL